MVMTFFMYVIDFYVGMIVTQKTDSSQTAKFGTMLVFSWAGLLSLFWNHPQVIELVENIKKNTDVEHHLSAGVIIAYLMFMIGILNLVFIMIHSFQILFSIFNFQLATNILSKPIVRQSGSFIGYSSLGNPLYSLTGEVNKTSTSLIITIKNIMREVIMNPDSKKIFLFLCLNLIFSLVELVYGALANSKQFYKN